VGNDLYLSASTASTSVPTEQQLLLSAVVASIVLLVVLVKNRTTLLKNRGVGKKWPPIVFTPASVSKVFYFILNNIHKDTTRFSS
jgi:hypothetical protein